MKKYFSNRLRVLRNEAKMSQEQLAGKLGVTTQAVSKWECDLAYPDIELLMQIADIYGVTIDSLLREAPVAEPQEAAIEEMKEENPLDTFPGLQLPDDDVIRIVQFKGRHLVTRSEMDEEIVIPIRMEKERSFLLQGREISVEIWGNVCVDGNLNGNLLAGGSVECEDIAGNVKAGGYVSCGDITGNAAASGYIECGDVEGNVKAGDYVSCGDVDGNVESCMGDIHCGDVEGDIHCGGSVYQG